MINNIINRLINERRKIKWQLSDKGIKWFFPEILMLKESWNLIGTPDLTQEKVNVSHSKISIDSFRRYCWSQNPIIWLDQRHTWPHLAKSDNLWCYLLLTIISIQKSKILIVSISDVVDQRILKPDWVRGTPGHIEPKN